MMMLVEMTSDLGNLFSSAPNVLLSFPFEKTTLNTLPNKLSKMLNVGKMKEEIFPTRQNLDKDRHLYVSIV